jgi:hypothetical protein
MYLHLTIPEVSVMENLSMKTGCGQVEQTIVEAVNLWVRLEPEKNP